MTENDLAAELYARQGYLVMGQNVPDPIGFEDRSDAHGTTFAYRIVATSNYQEWLAQTRLAHELNPDIAAYGDAPCNFYYRVEALD